MEINNSRWGLLNANSSRGKNHLSPRICSAQHPLATEIFGAMPDGSGKSNEGKAFLFHVIVLVSQQWSLPYGLLTVSGQTYWWSQSSLIPQSYRKPQKQAHINNSRAVPSKSTSGLLTQKKHDRDLRCSTPSWMISASQQAGTGSHRCKYWHSSSTVLWRKCWLMVRWRTDCIQPTQFWHVTHHTYLLLLAHHKCSRAPGHLYPQNLDRTLHDAKEHWTVCVPLSDGRGCSGMWSKAIHTHMHSGNQTRSPAADLTESTLWGWISHMLAL